MYFLVLFNSTSITTIISQRLAQPGVSYPL